MVKTIGILPEPLVVSSDIITDGLVDGVDVSALYDVVSSLGTGTTQQYVDTQVGTKVSKTGDTLTGALNMSGNNITNVGFVDGVDVSALYDVVSTKVSKTGDTLTGALNMSGNKITSLLDPVDPQDGATRAYVLANAGAVYNQSLNTTDNVSFNNMTTTGTVSSNVDIYIKNTAGLPPNVANWGTIRNDAGKLQFNYGGVVSNLNSISDITTTTTSVWSSTKTSNEIQSASVIKGYTFNSFSNAQAPNATASYNYYFPDIAPYDMLINTITLLIRAGGSDSVRVALFSDAVVSGGLLLGQSNATSGVLTSDAYQTFQLLNPVSLSRGTRFTLAVGIGGTTTSLNGSTVYTGTDLLSWYNTTDTVSAGFGTVGVSTTQSKTGNSTWRACAVFT